MLPWREQRITRLGLILIALNPYLNMKGCEELVDCLAVYFPVAFKPPPNDPHGITREALAAELEQTLACCPEFARHVMPLIFECVPLCCLPLP